ncbi:DNA polymerase [Sorangium sp. So ce1182]|uniref:DNA polymerase n=1 Tax=Sorangium sp. So ce1182 TaxID=3133334 RepID=UPI003F61F01F
MSVAYQAEVPNTGDLMQHELPFETHHISYLQERAVDPGWAAFAGLRSVTAEEGAKLLGREQPLPCGGIAIPYANVPGYTRIRLDQADPRYLAPAGREVPIYIPPGCHVEGSEPIHVVESPGKALALQDHGLYSVGLGGVQTTLTKKDYKLNESWNAVALYRREVVIVSDAGRAWNSDVARAEARLAIALEQAGAKVKLAALPPREGGGDQGPDDFLATSGRSELRKVLDAAVAADPVAHAKSVSAERAILLLGDLPFLWSLKERGVAVQKQVAMVLRKHGIKESDLRHALKETEEKSRNRRAEADQAQPRSFYAVREGKLCAVTSPDGVMEDCQPLANFTAQIDRDEFLDDGAEKTHSFTISGTLEDGRALPPVRLDPSKLSSDMWPRICWGARASVAAIPRAAAHLLAAMQAVSNPTQTGMFTHTGWREHDGEMIFLHADGVVGGAEAAVRLDGGLSRYKLPPVVEDLAGAVKLSLSFLDLTDPQITIPLFCAVFRAPLQHALYCDATVALCGTTGSLKTTLSALAMSHFGDFDAEHLPASWSSTANALERMAFLAKDVLLAVDDFAPTKAEAGDDLHRKAAQLLRAIGNANSRSRLQSDCSARPDRPPRALVLSTGEDVPSGESIQARLVTVRMKPGDVDLAKLTELQKNRRRLSHAMLGYLMWLKSQMPGLHTLMETRFIELRAELHQQGQHLRAPAALAHLLLGMEYFCLFAKDSGVLDDAGAAALLRRARASLIANAAEQSRAAVDANPVHRFIEVLRTLLLQGKVQTVDVAFALDTAEGHGIGWQDKDYLYLLPDAAYSAVVEALRARGQAMPLAARMLWSRLVDEGFVHGEEGRSTRKKLVGGVKGHRERVLWLRRDAIQLRDEIADLVDEAAAREDEEDPDDDPGGGGSQGGDGATDGDGHGSGSHLGFRFPVLRSPGPLGLASGPGTAPRSPVPQGRTGPRTGLNHVSLPSFQTEQFQEVRELQRELDMNEISQGPEAPIVQGVSAHAYAPQNDVDAGHVGAARLYGSASYPERCGAPGLRAAETPLTRAPAGVSARIGSCFSSDQLQDPGPDTRPEASQNGGGVPHETGPDDLEHFAAAILRAGRVGLVVHSTGPDLIDDGPVIVAIALPGGEARVFRPFGGEPLGPVAEALCEVTVVGHDLKRALTHLQYHLGFMPRVVSDTAIAWRLLDGGESLKNKEAFSFERACERAFGGKRSKKNIDLWIEPSPELQDEFAQEARDVLRLGDLFQKDIAGEHLEAVAELECKVLPIVAEMEVHGVPVDRGRWERIVNMWTAEAAELKKNLVAALGVQNVDSNDEVLAAFRRLGLQVERTNGEALAPYMHLPVVQQLIRYRRASSFVAGAGEGVLRALRRSEDGRLHATLNQIGASTGRMSAEHPNVLGLPRDKMIRGCITASPGNKLIVADYSTIELRVIADQTGDEQLKTVFQKNGDPHRHTASLVMGVPEEQVTEEQRRRAKPLNFGFSFAMGKDKLIAYARKNYGVELTIDEAERFRQRFFQSYPGVAAWQKKMAEQMPTKLRTKSGRISYYFDPDEEYNARLAFPVQGTAADGMKRAMVLLAPHIQRLGARMILAVHDELLVEAPEEHAEEVKELMRDCMIAGMKKYVLSVPIVVEPKVMSRWGK